MEIAYDVFALTKPLPVVLHIVGMTCPAFLISYPIARTLSRFRLTHRVVM